MRCAIWKNLKLPARADWSSAHACKVERYRFVDVVSDRLGCPGHCLVVDDNRETATTPHILDMIVIFHLRLISTATLGVGQPFDFRLDFLISRVDS